MARQSATRRELILVPNLWTALAEADAPDGNRDGLGASARLDDWFVVFLAMLLSIARQCVRAFRPCTIPTLPSWWVDRPDLVPGSAQHYAASIRGEFGNVIMRMCCRRGIGPGHPEWPYLSRAIVAFGGRPEPATWYAGRPLRPEWWENHWVSPAVIPPPPAKQSLLVRQAAAGAASPRPTWQAVPADSAHAVSWCARFQSSSRVLGWAATGPPGARAETEPVSSLSSLADFVTRS